MKISSPITIAFLFLFISLIFISCSKDTIVNNNTTLDTSSFKFPFQIGNTWNYTVTISVTDIKPDSIRYHFSNYPLTATGSLTILYDTLISGISTRCLYNVENQGSGTFAARYYYIQNDTALILYAKTGNASSGIMPDILNHIPLTQYRVNNYNNIVYNPYSIDSLSLFSNYIVLKYPIITGKTWNIYFNNGLTRTRKYMDFENVTMPAGTITCIKTKRTSSNFTDSSFTDYDYYSKYGLVKRNQIYNDMVVTTEWEPEGAGTADINFEHVVTSYTLH